MDEVTEMMRRLAAADSLPVETDAPPEDANPVPYDPGLQAELLEHGPEALQEYGMIVVRDVQRSERYNSAVWYALGHDLAYELKDGCVIITDPTSLKGA
jgi:hypothetical protein